MSLLNALRANPGLILRHRNIFLLSHMRANTSLFGHLLGSHPQVEGYYEMHIGYYSWKSLWRQKMLHFANHEPKPQAQRMFDKVLHDGHEVALPLLQRADSRAIFMVREPRQSVRSLMTLYRGDGKGHLPEATAEGATRYYVDRLATLARMAAQLDGRCFYLDAECLVQQPEPTLAALGTWLGLDGPIPTEYGTFANTGRGNSGDTSARLKSGKISRSANSYDDIVVPEACTAEAQAAYDTHRQTLMRHAAQRCTLDTAVPA